MVRLLLRDRRILLLALLALLVLVVSRLALPAGATVKTVVNGGYWVLLAIFTFFACAVGRIVRRAWQGRRPGRAELTAACLVLGAGGVLLAHQRYGFKILADEVLLLGTSMGMHYERSVAYPIRATDVQGPFQILQNVIDKRPFFYPFLVSLAHDFTGYRPENAFYVNTVLGFVMLALLFVIGRRVGGNPWAGTWLVLLFVGLPLFGQQMKGGGFELLNLVMISTTLLLAMEFADRRDESTLDAMIYGAVLLAYTRYESVLLIVPIALLVLWAWWREQRVILTWPVVLAPVALLLALLQNRVFTLNQGAWELASRPGSEVPFGLQYLRENLVHALGFFFDTTAYQPNSPWFAAIGLLACAFLVLWLLRVVRTLRSSPPADVAIAAVVLGLGAIWALLMVYFWGRFDDPVIHRLSLPVHLLMALATVVVGASFIRNVRVWQGACALGVLGLVMYSLPSMSRGAYAATYSPAAEMQWRTEFLRRFPERDYLFIDNDSVFWITHRIPASAVAQARERVDGLVYHLRNGSFSVMYVMQHYRIDGETGARRLEPTDDLGPAFELEPVWERRIQTLFIGRISRIKAIRQDGKVAATAGLLPTPPAGPGAAARSNEEWDAAKKAYVDQWLKQLP